MQEFFTNLLNKLSDFASSYLFDIVMALLIVFVGTKLVKFLIKIINKTKGFSKLDGAVKSFLNSFIKIFLYVVVFISAATTLGIPMTSFLTIFASCGLAIGLALQGSLSNLAGGIMILIFKPFKMGDYIVSGGTEGTVSEINIFYTRLTTPDNKIVTIPNGTLSNSTVVDVTGKDTRRVDINIGVSYSADLKEALGVLSKIGENCSFALADPAPVAIITGYGDSSVNLSLRVWTKTENYWGAFFEMNEAVKKEFDKNNIEIPFPQMDVHIKQ